MVSVPKNRVLVVDDDPTMRDLVASRLSHHGYADDSVAVVVVPIAAAQPLDAIVASLERSHTPLLCSLAELERAHVADDGPAILDGNLWGVFGHGPEAARDDVEIVAN